MNIDAERRVDELLYTVMTIKRGGFRLHGPRHDVIPSITALCTLCTRLHIAHSIRYKPGKNGTIVFLADFDALREKIEEIDERKKRKIRDQMVKAYNFAATYASKLRPHAWLTPTNATLLPLFYDVEA